MKKQIVCEFQSAVVKSLKSPIADNTIGEHLKICADCRKTLKVAGFFQTHLTEEKPPLNLPAAGLIWWKSNLREKRRVAERAVQPIKVAQTVAVVIFTAAFLWLFINESPPLIALGDGINRVAGSAAQFIFPALIGFASFAFVCLATVLLMRRFLSER